MELIRSLVRYKNYERAEITYKGSLATLLSSLTSTRGSVTVLIWHFESQFNSPRKSESGDVHIQFSQDGGRGASRPHLVNSSVIFYSLDSKFMQRVYRSEIATPRSKNSSDGLRVQERKNRRYTRVRVCFIPTRILFSRG